MSSLRERQREMTRELMLDAAARLTNEKGVTGFSMDEVASRAGVSLRTVYRYFPSRDDLLVATARHLSVFLDATLAEMPDDVTLDWCMASVGRGFEIMSEHEQFSRATIAMIGLAEQGGALPALTAARRARHEGIRALVGRDLPDLPEEMVDQVFAVVRLMASIIGWGGLTGPPAQLGPREAGTVVHWASRVLLERARELQAASVTSLAEDL